MNNGMASSGKLSRALDNRWATRSSGKVPL